MVDFSPKFIFFESLAGETVPLTRVVRRIHLVAYAYKVWAAKYAMIRYSYATGYQGHPIHPGNLRVRALEDADRAAGEVLECGIVPKNFYCESDFFSFIRCPFSLVISKLYKVVFAKNQAALSTFKRVLRDAVYGFETPVVVVDVPGVGPVVDHADGKLAKAYGSRPLE